MQNGWHVFHFKLLPIVGPIQKTAVKASFSSIAFRFTKAAVLFVFSLITA